MLLSLSNGVVIELAVKYCRSCNASCKRSLLLVIGAILSSDGNVQALGEPSGISCTLTLAAAQVHVRG